MASFRQKLVCRVALLTAHKLPTGDSTRFRSLKILGEILTAAAQRSKAVRNASDSTKLLSCATPVDRKEERRDAKAQPPRERRRARPEKRYSETYGSKFLSSESGHRESERHATRKSRKSIRKWTKLVDRSSNIKTSCRTDRPTDRVRRRRGETRT